MKSSGGIYLGNFENDKLNGLGLYKFANGNADLSIYKNN